MEEQSFRLKVHFALKLAFLCTMGTLEGTDLEREKTSSPKNLDFE